MGKYHMSSYQKLCNEKIDTDIYIYYYIYYMLNSKIDKKSHIKTP